MNMTFDVEAERLRLEQKKLDLEQERIALERERFRSEREMRKWTIASVAVPLIVVALTLAFSVWSQVEQSRREFALRAAEIIVGSEGPGESQGRLRALLALFPNQLPPDFQSAVESFNPSLYGVGPSYEDKMSFLRLVFESGGQNDRVIEMYDKLFPGSPILDAIQP